MPVHSNLIDILAWTMNLFGPLSIFMAGLIFRRKEHVGTIWMLSWLWVSFSYTILVTPVWVNSYHSIEDIDNAPAVFGLILIYYALIVVWFFLTYVMRAWSFLCYLSLIFSAIIIVIAASIAVFTFPEPHGWHYTLYLLALGPLLCLLSLAWDGTHIHHTRHEPKTTTKQETVSTKQQTNSTNNGSNIVFDFDFDNNHKPGSFNRIGGRI